MYTVSLMVYSNEKNIYISIYIRIWNAADLKKKLISVIIE